MATKKQETQHLNNLIKRIEEIEDTIKMGDKLFFNYMGEIVAEYQFVEWSGDAKSPMDWFRGCLFFEVTMNGGDVTKVHIGFKKNTDPDIFRKMFKL